MMHSTETSDKQVVDMLKTVPHFFGLSSSFFLNSIDATTGKSYKDGELIIFAREKLPLRRLVGE